MDILKYSAVARALHILSIVIWIGGVTFVTTILLPAVIKNPDKMKRLQLFEELENSFSFQAKFTTSIALLSGLYLTYALHAWDRFLTIHFWWMHLMLLVWFLFFMVLFVFEPLFLHQWFKKMAQIDSDKTFKIIQLMHIVLMTISFVAVLGATLGAHGFF